LPLECLNQVITIEDVPDDEGGWISVSWEAFSGDAPGAQTPIVNYIVQRLEDAIWEDAGTTEALELPSYTVVIETADIYTIGEPAPSSTYRVRGNTATPGVFCISNIATGYSLDNLPPVVPELFLVGNPGYRVLLWNNPENEDFLEVCIYRERGPVTEPGEPVACTADGLYNEEDLNYFCYVIDAYDIHGNKSDYSNEVCCTYPTNADELPRKLTLEQNKPNPFNPQTIIAFDLPKQTAVVLRVFDLSGRLVRVLLDREVFQLGRNEVVWNGFDDSGRQKPSGTYFYRLDAGGYCETKRMTLVK